jgi:ABC-type lipoprotein export system ATPase subunit
MSSYTDDLKAIKSSEQKMARFFHVALHCHSPLSNDWGMRDYADKKLNAKQELLSEGGEEKYLGLILAQGNVDLLTVTDHMKCAYAERVVVCAKKTGHIVVLPGMEVNFRTSPALANVRVHIIIILPNGCTRETFGKLLPGLPEEDERKHADTVTGQDLQEWIQQVHALEGICIAAHVENTNGIRYCFRQTARSVMKLMSVEGEKRAEQESIVDGGLRDLILDAGFDGVEIKKPEDRHHYRWEEEGSGRKLATVLGLDAHCIEDFARVGELTLVKMTEVGIHGLRDAMKFPETRIRFACDLKEPPSPRLLGVTVKGGVDSFFEDLTCAFSQNLNCVIGPRGSGKSTLVEALRYVFGYNRTLDELDTTNKLSDRVRSLQRATLTNCQIRVYYQRKDGKVRVLEATFDAKQDYTTRVFDEDGKGAPIDDVERSGEYPLRLYGWSEIETLGRDRSKQRALLDRMIPNLTDAIERRKDVRDKLRVNRESIRARIRDLVSILKRDGGEIYRYAEYKKDFEELNQEEVKARFEEIDLLEAKKSVFEVISKNVSDLSGEIEGLEPVALTVGVEKVIDRSGKGLAKWWQDEQIQDRAIIDAERFIAGELGKIKQNLQQIEQKLHSKESEIRSKLEESYETVRNVLSGEPNMQRIADLRQNAKTRLLRVTALRDEYLAKWEGLRDLLSERHRIGEEFKRSQNEITGVRAGMIDNVQKRLNELMGAKLKIEIKIRPGCDKAEFEQALENFLRAPRHRINRGMQQVATAKYNPVDFGNLILERNWDVLKGQYNLAGDTVDIDGDNIDKLKDIKDWYERSDEADLKVLMEDGERLLSVLELQEVGWDDEERIFLNDRPVDELSPGQRSSAMLPLIALAEDSPLVIDQPEDNLDNRLIGQVLVDILAELKERRQIIVCTHNPNIVVSGDAEQVIALDAKTDRKGEMAVAGSIDNEDIVQTVIDLMEGGKEAFRVRKERYGLRD